MIRLTVPDGPSRIDLKRLPLPVWMIVRPFASPLSEAAKDRAGDEIRELVAARETMLKAGASLDGLPDLDDPHVRGALVRILYARHLAAAAVIEWGGAGVEDPETGLVAEVVPATIEQLMLFPEAARSFIDAYSDTVDRIVAEGNASGAASPGISGVAPNIVPGADLKASPVPTAG